MKLQTPVEIEDYPFQIDYRSKILMIGSCFSENIGLRLKESKFQIVTNPFGILYNPQSIANSLERIIGNEAYVKNDLFFHNNSYHSFDHHGLFSNRDINVAVESINKSLDRSNKMLKEAKILIITLGTAFVYEEISSGRVVANCHKVPDIEFKRYLLDPSIIQTKLDELHTKLRAFNPGLKILMTVSPVRHFRDGMISNQRSKASLILAVHNFIGNHDNVFYFPSYELMMDEWRDYRYYDEDLVHPSSTAIQLIWERFSSNLFSPATIQLMEQIQSIIKASKHRPFDQESEAFKKFASDHVKKIILLKEKYKFLDFEHELKHFDSLSL